MSLGPGGGEAGMTASPGEVKPFGSYLLVGELGKGGMAEILFAARRERPGEILAIKRILKEYLGDQSFRRYFSAEVQLSLRMQHPNVVRAYEAGEIENIPYLAMEYIHGRALNRVIHDFRLAKRRIPVPYALYVAIEILKGIEYFHGITDDQGRPADAVLCDLTPSNVLVSHAGDIKLIDFGVACSNLKYIEQIGLPKGKKTYMSPEQLRGLPIDQRVDIFAAGLCLFEMLTLSPAFAGRTEFEVEEAVRKGRLPTLSEHGDHYPPGLEETLWRALAFDPAERFQTAGEFADALEPFARLGKGRRPDQTDFSVMLRTFFPREIAADDEFLAEMKRAAEEGRVAGPAAPGSRLQGLEAETATSVVADNAKPSA